MLPARLLLFGMKPLFVPVLFGVMSRAGVIPMLPRSGRERDGVGGLLTFVFSRSRSTRRREGTDVDAEREGAFLDDELVDIVTCGCCANETLFKLDTRRLFSSS